MTCLPQSLGRVPNRQKSFGSAGLLLCKHIQLAEHSLPPTPPPRCKSHIVSTSHKVKPWSQDWLIAAGAYSGFCSMKRLEVFLLPPGWDASPSQVTPPQLVSQQFASTHLYTWGERSIVRVQSPAQEQRTMSPARARTRTARSGVERTNHEANLPLTIHKFNVYFLL